MQADGEIERIRQLRRQFQGTQRHVAGRLVPAAAEVHGSERAQYFHQPHGVPGAFLEPHRLAREFDRTRVRPARGDQPGGDVEGRNAGRVLGTRGVDRGEQHSGAFGDVAMVQPAPAERDGEREMTGVAAPRSPVQQHRQIGPFGVERGELLVAVQHAVTGDRFGECQEIFGQPVIDAVLFARGTELFPGVQADGLELAEPAAGITLDSHDERA